MDRDIAVELAKYRSIHDYTPTIGDIVIKHGWLFAKTKWFGIVHDIAEDGTITVVHEGLPYLLFTTPPTLFASKSVRLHPAQMLTKGAYTVVQHDKTANCAIWYI